LSVSRDDDGGIGLASSDNSIDADALNAFLDTPLRTHLVANKPGILSLVDAEPVAEADGDNGGYDDAELISLAKQSDSPTWREALRITAGKVAGRRWLSHVRQSHAAGLRAQDQKSFVDAETARLTRVCGL
jgi:hypothetical protein